MEKFPGSNWSEKADAYTEGLAKTKGEISEYERKEMELKEKLEATPVESRAPIFTELTEVRKKLREAKFNLEALQSQGGKNLKKAA